LFTLLIIDAVDIHFPHLLTGSTLDFASDVKTPRIKVAGQSTSQAVRDMTSIYSRLLGIQHTLETKVGNEYVQGVSGGERKRVTLAEGVSLSHH
jgi:ABC-type multidrug transport system ATPase subunit